MNIDMYMWIAAGALKSFIYMKGIILVLFQLHHLFSLSLKCVQGLY